MDFYISRRSATRNLAHVNESYAITRLRLPSLIGIVERKPAAFVPPEICVVAKVRHNDFTSEWIVSVCNQPISSPDSRNNFLKLRPTTDDQTGVSLACLAWKGCLMSNRW